MKPINFVDFTELLQKMNFAHRGQTFSLHSVEITEIHSHCFGKNSVKATFSQVGMILVFRPLVDTFKMYLYADTDTFPQKVSVPIQIQYQKMYLCADTDTFPNTF